MQNDFLPGGTLAVPRGDEVVPIINSLAARFDNVILTQDWHPPDHISFASAHPGKNAFETAELAYGPQVLWPSHCVQGMHGAAFAAELQIDHAQAVIRKASRLHRHYSALVEADRQTPTRLLKQHFYQEGSRTTDTAPGVLIVVLSSRPIGRGTSSERFFLFRGDLQRVDLRRGLRLTWHNKKDRLVRSEVLHRDTSAS